MKKLMTTCSFGLVLLFSVFVISTSACLDSSTESPGNVSELDTMALPQDFIDFYVKFHNDSAYQMEHILFPLRGIPINKDTLTSPLNEYRFKKNNWILHLKNPTLNKSYTVDFKMPAKKMVIEKVTHNTGLFGMERRFSKSDGEWNLIFYGGMNELKDWTPR